MIFQSSAGCAETYHCRTMVKVEVCLKNKNCVDQCQLQTATEKMLMFRFH